MPSECLALLRDSSGDAPTCSGIRNPLNLSLPLCQPCASAPPKLLDANRPSLWLSFGLPAHPARRRFLRPQPLELSRIELAVAHCVLQPLVAQECGARLEVGASDEIEATGMAQHVRVDFQHSEFSGQLEPIEHSPKRSGLHPEHTISRSPARFAQWPEKPFVLLGQRVLAGLRSFQAANQYAPLLPLDIRPAQVAQFGNAQAVVEGNPDRSGVASTVAVLLRSLTKDKHFLPAQVLARPPLFVGDALWPELCSIFGVWGCCLDPPKARRLPRPRQRL